MRRVIFLMLICSSANAAMYSCVDENGTKILRNYPCEQNEKQKVIENKVEPSYYIINGTGERQSFQSHQAAQQNEPVNSAPKNLYDRAMAAANSGADLRSEMRGARFEGVIKAAEAWCAALGGDQQSLYDRAMAAANSGDQRSEMRGARFYAVLRAAKAECALQRAAGGQNKAAVSGRNIGQCIEACDSEQGICSGNCSSSQAMCSGNCNGDGQCYGNCASSQGMCMGNCGAAHGRCVSMCN